MGQRYDIEHHIAPPMRKAITLCHKSGIVVYVAQSAFGPKGEDQTEAELDRVARLIATALKEEN